MRPTRAAALTDDAPRVSRIQQSRGGRLFPAWRAPRRRTPLSSRLAAFSGALIAGATLAYAPNQARSDTTDTAPLTVALRAAAAEGATHRMEVRVRWTVTDGWLPAGGFNLYRSDASTPVNSTALGGSLANAPATLAIGATHRVQLGTLLSKAAIVPATGTLPPLTTPVVRGASAASRFSQLATAAQQRKGLPPRQTSGLIAPTSATTAAAAGTASGAAGAAAARPAPVAPLPQAAAPRVTAPSIADQTIAARRTLLLGAATHPEMAATLGLAYDDPNVTPGQTYTYTLRRAVGGLTAPTLATVTITVPQSTAGLKPPAPVGLQAVQLTAGTVGLRWQRLSIADETQMGVASYNVYRVATSSLQSKPFDPKIVAPLNDVPVLVTDIVTGTAGDTSAAGAAAPTEPTTFYTDSKLVTADAQPITGAMTYLLTVTDVFGRTSDPSSVAITIQDWRKPLPVPFAAAQLQATAQLAGYLAARSRLYHRGAPFFKTALTAQPPAQPVQVVWAESSGLDASQNLIWNSNNRQQKPDLAYRVYRVDAEHTNDTPQLLTSTAIQGGEIQATQLPAGTLRDNAAQQMCIPLFSAAGCGSSSMTEDFKRQLLSNLWVFTYTDSAAQKDHYYRYFVTTVFVHSAEESAYAPTNIVAYANLSPPGAPTTGTSSFQPAASPGTSGSAATSSATGQSGSLTALASQLLQKHPCTLSARKKTNCTDPKDVKPLTLTNWTGPLVKPPPRDLGGTLQIKWAGGAEAVRYEVYRANATRATASHVVAPPAAAMSCSSGSSTGGKQKVNVNGTTVSVNTPLCSAAGAKVSSLTLAWQRLGDPDGAGAGLGNSGPGTAAPGTGVPTGKAGSSSTLSGGNSTGTSSQLQDSDFVLLGTTKTPEFDDPISRSSAHYYVYRVVPVNRWNVPGPLLSVQARAPATLPPAEPKLLVGTASSNGGVDVEFIPVGDAGEEIQTYELWRVTLSSTVLAGLTGSGTGTTAATSTGATTTSNSIAATGQAYAANRAAVAPSTDATRAAASAARPSLTSNGPPASVTLAGAAARYGVALHRPVMFAAARAGIGLPSALTLQNLQQSSAVKVATLTGSQAMPGAQVWLSEAQTAALDWRDDYAYWVRAVDSDSLQSDSEVVDVTPLKVSAAAPTGLSATWNATNCQVDVSWQAADQEPAGYIVERELAPSATSTGTPHTATTQGGQSVTLGLTAANSGAALQDRYIQLGGITSATAATYADHSVFPDSSYLYRVRTLDKAGNISAPAVLSSAVAVPDGCGNTPTKRIQKRPLSNAPGTDATDTVTPVTSPPTPTAPKPADEIEIPTTRSPN